LVRHSRRRQALSTVVGREAHHLGARRVGSRLPAPRRKNACRLDESESTPARAKRLTNVVTMKQLAPRTRFRSITPLASGEPLAQLLELRRRAREQPGWNARFRRRDGGEYLAGREHVEAF